MWYNSLSQFIEEDVHEQKDDLWNPVDRFRVDIFSNLLYTLMHPCVYNGIGGLMGAFLGADTLVPFIISTVVMCAGLLLCFIEAYRKH